MKRTTTAWLAAAALSILGAGACHDPAPGGTNASASADPTPQATGDVSIPGVDTSGMTPRERKEFTREVKSLMAPCADVATSVADCVIQHRTCGACLDGVKFVAEGVRRGLPSETIEDAYKHSFDPAAVHVLPTEGSGSMGPDNAKVTIVEFADFECPHCKLAVPEIDGIYEAHKNDVRVVYKFYPLPGHEHARVAAYAAYAAGLQGKFWEMHHAIYENQLHLEEADLERYAKKLGLDFGKFKADMNSPAAKARVEQDRKLGEELKLEGTPTFFVNGRQYVAGMSTMEELVARQLGEDPSKPVHTPSAAPAASASAQAAKKAEARTPEKTGAK